MPNILILGYSGEGDTDRRFLGPLIQRTFEDLLFTASGQIDCLPPVWLGEAKSKDIAKAALEAGKDKLMLYCAHVDEDGKGHQRTVELQLKPALDLLEVGGGNYPPVIPIMPKEETESWLLADTDTLRGTLNTQLTASQLGLQGNPESYTDPKQKLIDVIRIVNAEPARYIKVEKGTLYAPMGADCSLAELRKLASFSRFEAAARAGLVEIGYLQV
jgi:hypothetical protein